MAFQYGPAPVIQPARLQALFLELVQIDSLSRREGRIAARLSRELAELGAEVSFDDAGAAVGGETGNLIAHVPGTVDAPALLLCAHMDTVEPGVGVRPVVEDDVIRSDGTTVLGGDDKSGVAIVCECVRACRERGLSHPPLDVVFTICEEVGLLGARHLDFARIRARRGLVFDSDAVGLHGAGARRQRDPGGGRGDRGDAARAYRPRDHGQPRHHHGRARGQHRPGRGARTRRGAQPRPRAPHDADRAHAGLLRGGRRAPSGRGG
ncbi:MAG: M20/M25/M40 family metallo-hydrolase [Deltaproteobacteria bacterium]|nr:MAG: M20/M25/M40 family metallo-hydrolase [Deltaproteobacteria bacterium]